MASVVMTPALTGTKNFTCTSRVALSGNRKSFSRSSERVMPETTFTLPLDSSDMARSQLSMGR